MLLNHHQETNLIRIYSNLEIYRWIQDSLDMSVDNQKPISLIDKSKLDEVEEIKGEDSNEESEKDNLKEHIIDNDSEECDEEESEEGEDYSPSILHESKLSQKEIKEIWQRNYHADVSASDLISKKYYRIKYFHSLSPL